MISIMKWDKLVKDIRKSLFLSQEDFAKKIGVAFCSINRYENKKTKPTFKVQRQLIGLAKKINFNYKKYEE